MDRAAEKNASRETFCTWSSAVVQEVGSPIAKIQMWRQKDTVARDILPGGNWGSWRRTGQNGGGGFETEAAVWTKNGLRN